MPFQKGHSPFNKKMVSGPGFTGISEPSPAEVLAELEQEARESDPANKTPLGQGQFDKNLDAAHAYNRQTNIDGGVPEHVLDYKPVDHSSLPKFSEAAVRAMYPADFDSTSVPDKLAKMYGLNLANEVPKWDYQDGYDNRGTSFEAQ